MSEVTVEALIAASPDDAYHLVSDVTRMGDWSPETTSCRWIGAATGAAVGARFRGSNRKGWRRWSTTCTVVAADAGRRFAFDVSWGRLPIARWSYEFLPEADGTRVRETWSDRRPGWMARFDPAFMGIDDRSRHNRGTMETTLERLRSHAAATSSTTSSPSPS